MSCNHRVCVCVSLCLTLSPSVIHSPSKGCLIKFKRSLLRWKNKHLPRYSRLKYYPSTAKTKCNGLLVQVQSRKWGSGEGVYQTISWSQATEWVLTHLRTHSLSPLLSPSVPLDWYQVAVDAPRRFVYTLTVCEYRSSKQVLLAKPHHMHTPTHPVPCNTSWRRCRSPQTLHTLNPASWDLWGITEWVCVCLRPWFRKLCNGHFFVC
jgi:hypothetical protein